MTKKNSEETDFIREDEKTYNPYKAQRTVSWIRQSKHPKAANLKELFGEGTEGQISDGIGRLI